ncbi:MAG: hypothetical protein WAV18_25930, partial [Roseiarcus sp.]
MPTAPRARSFALKGLQFYGNLINFCRGALACHCEFRTGLRPVPLDETTRSRVMPANAGIQNATSLSGFELFIG